MSRENMHSFEKFVFSHEHAILKFSLPQVVVIQKTISTLRRPARVLETREF